MLMFNLNRAIKVALGDDIGGLFSNNDDLAFILQSCSQISGDPLENASHEESKKNLKVMLIFQTVQMDLVVLLAITR